MQCSLNSAEELHHRCVRAGHEALGAEPAGPAHKFAYNCSLMELTTMSISRTPQSRLCGDTVTHDLSSEVTSIKPGRAASSSTAFIRCEI